MAANPNAIFGQALAVGPRQIPLSELQGQMAQTALTQQQTAQGAQETRGLAQQNELRRRQIEDDQAVRDTLARWSKQYPVTAPNVSLPQAGVDADGNPLPNPPEYHQAGAANAIQLQSHNIYGAYGDLMRQGRPQAANTLLKTWQGIQSDDLKNAQDQMKVYEADTKRRNELTAPVFKAQQEDPDSAPGLATQAGITLEQEGRLPKGAGAKFGVPEAIAMYRSTSAAAEPVATARATLEGTQAETGLRKAQAKLAEETAAKTQEETKQYKLANDAAEQFLKDPDAVLGSGGMIDKIGLEPEDAKTVKAAAMAAYQMPGTFQEKAAAVKSAILDGVKSVLDFRRAKRLSTDPDIIAAQANKGALERQDIARLAGGALANVPTEGLQRLAFQTQTKAQAEYSKAEANAQRLFDTADLAQRNGNQIASGMLPLEVLREVVPRVARQEIPMAQGGVSIARRFQNWIDRGATGVPSDITIKDIRDFGKAMLAGAKSQYATTMRGVNKTTRSDFDEAPESNLQTGPAATPATSGPVRVTTKAQRDALPNGTQYIDSKGNIATKGR